MKVLYRTCTFVALLLLYSTFSCSERVCDPGKQEACACIDGARGAQECKANGSGWEPCRCATPFQDGGTKTDGTLLDSEPPDNNLPPIPEKRTPPERTTPERTTPPEKLTPPEKAADQGNPDTRADTNTNTDDGPLLAFPGAVGFGAKSKGGRGGKVLFVENLNDAGPGSLRAAIDTSGPRTVIFRVGGTIVLKNSLSISKPYITIAGQTAPGDGIQIRIDGKKDITAISISTNDVIIRYLRVRPGPGPQGSQNGDGIGIYDGASNIIIDHCSISWTTDEIVNGWYDPHSFTFQKCIFGGALDKSTHAKGTHGYGPLIGDKSRAVTLYQNLFLNNTQRNPSIALPKTSVVQVVNNVNYNCKYYNTVASGGSINIQGNYYKAGPDTRTTRFEVDIEDDPQKVQVFVQGNIGWHRTKTSDPDWAVVGSNIGANWTNASTKTRVSKPFTAPQLKVLSATDAYNEVLRDVGATLPKRDSLDARYIEQVKNNKGTIINNPADLGGWPALKSGKAPDDTDRDGMPDAWETQHGFDPKDPKDAQLDRDKDGYTNLEEFLNNTRP